MLPSADGSFSVRRIGGSVSELVRRTETFIVRIWAEYLEQQTPPAWRGEIEHVGDAEVMHFIGLDELCEHVRRYTKAQHTPDEQEGKE
jgi:hypothetical protein